jgi:DNA-binding phage protein
MISNIERTCLGNSDRSLKNLASDLLAESGKKGCKKVAEQAYLNTKTVERVLDCDPHYQPRLDTVERILRACNVRLESGYIATQSKYKTKPKDR